LIVSTAAVLGGLAAIAQIAAYLVYLHLFRAGKIEPNGTSWLMFAYGTALLVFLEVRNGAAWFELALPVACGTMSVIVSVLCFRSNAVEPADGVEKLAFGADLSLTIAYLAVALAVSGQSKYAVAFLVAGNLTAFTSFAPLVRSTWHSPSREQPLPWMMWTVAYALLFASTFLSEGFRSPELLLYPGLCVSLHGLVALFASKVLAKHTPLNEPKEHRTMNANHSSTETIYLRTSSISGMGIHAGVPFAAGQFISELTGTILLDVATDASPNAVGVARGVWIDPEFPLVATNHSCDPNAAFTSERTLAAIRQIAIDEEITIDYSVTEADTEWKMACACAMANCRGTLRSIQITFADAAEVPKASPGMQRVWLEERHKFQSGQTIDLTATDELVGDSR
jgi:SET domain